MCVCSIEGLTLSFVHRGGADPLILVTPEETSPLVPFSLHSPEREGTLNNTTASVVGRQHYRGYQWLCFPTVLPVLLWMISSLL